MGILTDMDASAADGTTAIFGVFSRGNYGGLCEPLARRQSYRKRSFGVHPHRFPPKTYRQFYNAHALDAWMILRVFFDRALSFDDRAICDVKFLKGKRVKESLMGKNQKRDRKPPHTHIDVATNSGRRSGVGIFGASHHLSR